MMDMRSTPFRGHPYLFTIFFTDDGDIQDKLNEMRLGEITRECAKLFEQHVNSLLIESDILIIEKIILPKLLHLCMIRFEDEKSLARGDGELRQEEHLLISNICKCEGGGGGRSTTRRDADHTYLKRWRIKTTLVTELQV
jgi:hypothetical protein